MHFSGHEVISRSTKRGMRNLLVSSFTLLTLSFHHVALDSFTIFGLEFPEGTVSDSLLLIHFVILFSFLISWIGDLISIGYWNSGELVSFFGTALDGTKQSASRTAVVIHQLETQIGILELVASKGKPLDPHINKFSQALRELERLNQKQKHHRIFFYIYFYVWYLVFPMIMSMLAIYFWFDLGVEVKPVS